MRSTQHTLITYLFRRLNFSSSDEPSVDSCEPEADPVAELSVSVSSFCAFSYRCRFFLPFLCPEPGARLFFRRFLWPMAENRTKQRRRIVTRTAPTNPISLDVYPARRSVELEVLLDGVAA